MGNNVHSTLDVDKIYNLVKERINSLGEDRSFNIIEAAVRTRLRETLHSRILANLLRYDKAILKSFLENFSLSDIVDQEWEISVEKNNMDIVLEGTQDVIIIENKVNNACERPRQIDRYVKQVHSSDPHKKIHVLYLNRSNNCKPSEFSWKDSKDICEFIARSYEHHVYKWLRELIGNKQIDDSLREGIKPYLDYLDIIFGTKTKDMEKDIEKRMTELLELNDESQSIDESINKLDNAVEIFGELQNVCQTMSWERTWKKIQTEVNEYLVKNGLPLLSSQEDMEWDLPDAGIPFKLKRHGDQQFYAVISYLQKRYVGIINTSQPKENKEEFDQTFGEMFNSLGVGYSTPRYPIWFYCDNDKDLIDKYKQMVDILIRNSEGDDPKVVALRK